MGVISNTVLASFIDASDNATGTIIDDDGTLLAFEFSNYQIKKQSDLGEVSTLLFVCDLFVSPIISSQYRYQHIRHIVFTSLYLSTAIVI